MTLKKWLAIILLGAGIVWGGFYLHQQHVAKEKTEPRLIRTVTELHPRNVKILGDRQQYVLSDHDTDLVGGRYLFGRDYKEWKAKKDSTSTVEYISFTYYDVETKKSRTINVLDTIPQKNKIKKITRLGLPTISGIAYKNTVYIEALEDNKTTYTIKKNYYNLDTNSYYTPSTTNKIPSALKLDGIALSLTNLDDQITNLGYFYDVDYRGIAKALDKKADTDNNLFSEFPEIKNDVISGKKILSIRFDQVQEKEVFNTLMHWFAPKGQETLSGVKIKAEYSKDGQEHEIHSYDEFKQFYNGKGGELIE